MSVLNTRIHSALGGAFLTIFVGLPALADDIEIYRGSTGAQPNVLFVLDTSGSMDTTVISTPPAYDPGTTYEGSCNADRIYFTTNSSTPTCSTGNWFPRTSNTCKASEPALVNVGGGGAWPALGNSRRKAAQLRSSEWRSIQGGHSGYVECEPDNGVHGQTDASTSRYPRDSSAGWGTTDRGVWDDLDNTYRFFTANYLNYANSVGAPVAMTRLEIVRNVAMNLASTLENVNLGLMRYSTNAQGGYVLNAVEDIETNRAAILATLGGFDPDDGTGGTPLSETYYEAARYLTGRSVQFGAASTPGQSVAGSRITGSSPSTYKTPIANECQKNYIVYLTDGAPTLDHHANTDIATMIGRTCAADPVEPYHDLGWTVGSGICMDDLAAWLHTTDLSTAQRGDQTASTFVIGFGNSVAASVGYLDTVARAGGTEHAFTAADVPTLTSALESIFAGIQEDSGTFVTPSVSVNAFNRAHANNDLFFSLFKVASGPHWAGNLKKYELDVTQILDANGDPAVNSAGFFDSRATSFWSAAVDGNDVQKGGAASRLPEAATRNVYTYVSAEPALADVANRFDVTNSALTDAVVGSGLAAMGCTATCQTTINWARGYDVRDRDRDLLTTDTDRFMGDPLHGRPGLVSYGGTPSDPDADDIVVFVPTNDGFLHAIAGHTGGGGGEELWAFIPPELLSRLHSLYENTTAAQRTYGLDGDVRVMKLDKNQDGIVEASAGDKVWLFFGMRMGGSHYYALDVTDRNNPKLLWRIGPTELPGLGQSWSPPSIARVRVGTANDNAEKFVLIFGGGYDMGQEVQPYSADDVGNRIFMVDAETGDRLWYAGPSDGTPGPDLALASMTNAIPGRITVIDIDGDLFADRMYAADLGGRVWRFDITNGNAASSLVAGGVIAKLGTGDNGALAASEARRFYNAPDVSLVRRRLHSPYFNIAIGSGHRGHPLDEVTSDRFYSVRDKRPYAQLTQADFDAIVPIVDSGLRDITSDPMGIHVLPADAGWKFHVSGRTGRSGEKMLGEATTVNNVILFTTFQPLDPSAEDPCYPVNVNRVYAITVDGKPALDFFDDSSTEADDGKITNEDISTELDQTGIVGDVTVALMRGTDAPPETVCIAGVEVLSKCVGVGGTIRTFWQRIHAD